MSEYKGFGKWLYETRMAKKLTLRKIGQKSGLESLTIGRLSDIEWSREKPTPQEIEAIHKAFGIEVAEKKILYFLNTTTYEVEEILPVEYAKYGRTIWLEKHGKTVKLGRDVFKDEVEAKQEMLGWLDFEIRDMQRAYAALEGELSFLDSE